MNVRVVNRLPVNRIPVLTDSQENIRRMHGPLHAETTLAQCMLSDIRCRQRWHERERNPHLDGFFKDEMNTTFLLAASGGTLTEITFTLNHTIYIDEAIRQVSAEYDEVLAHERRHATDFFAEFDLLLAALGRVSTLTRDELNTYLEWFEYRLEVRTVAYHRSIGQREEVATPPLSTDPYGRR